ncbi:MAG: DNA repair protein RecN [Proteobacteria bacterium]|nr:DNA repair protein RecN [Pseudomonadota bacterium]
MTREKMVLANLSIQNIVLIDRLELEFEAGLSVLTGETGAGKSILLDSLGLVLGARADGGLLRAGAKNGVVAAEFLIESDHPVHAVLNEHGLEDEGEALRLRRQLSDDGRSRAFINDQPVGANLLRQVGDLLVEIHGQHGQQGLLNPATHRELLDSFGGHGDSRRDVAVAYDVFQAATKACDDAEERIARARDDEDFLRHAVNELQLLAPQPGEEETLAADRTLMMHSEQVSEELAEVLSAIAGDKGAEARLRVALGRLERVAEKAGGRLEAAIDSVGRAFAEAEDAARTIEAASRDLQFNPQILEQSEERLFALRAAARKYNCQVDGLPDVQNRLEQELSDMEKGEEGLMGLRHAVATTREAFSAAVETLRAGRENAAKKMDAAIALELPPLKLEKATIQTRIDHLPEDRWSGSGGEDIRFEVSTNPGTPMGPLSKIASGGELSRFALALKVVLARAEGVRAMIFDEIDQGVGGAVAAALGERLSRLADQAQVLVVTHSPQVAARGAHHIRVGKVLEGDAALTLVEVLSDSARREEIARMLAGAEVTDEARAAAARLIEGVTS